MEEEGEVNSSKSSYRVSGEKNQVMARPWEGFWQMLSDSEDEDVVPFRNTTIAVRKNLGFVVLTGSHFMEIRVDEKRQALAEYPRTEREAAAIMRHFHAYVGQCNWREERGGWRVEQDILMASDPRFEGHTIQSKLDIDGDQCRRKGTLPKSEELTETWRRLSGAGASPLSGAWETRAGEDWWIYLATAGHYGVMRVASSRPRTPSNREEFSDAELYVLLKGFGAHAGARLETRRTFDHWAMIGYIAGGEERKHPTFRIDSVKENEVVFSIPHRVERSEVWRRID